MTRFVLASKSPRRRALLGALGLSFEVVESGMDEFILESPEETVVSNARMKRDDVLQNVSASSVVIAADTVVVDRGTILGKPVDVPEARAMLRRLSGKTHHVLTGLAVTDTRTGLAVEGFERTGVTFRTLTCQEIDRFIEAVNPVDRAGAYTVDGPGSLLVESYDGCYQNVLGLPVVRLDKLLREIGYSLFDFVHGPDAVFL